MTEKDKRHNITLLANYALIASAETLTSHAVDLCDYFKRGKGVPYYEHKMRGNVNDLVHRLRFHEWEVNNAYGDSKQILCDILDYYNEAISPDVVRLKCAVHNFVGRHVHGDAETIAVVETGRILSAIHVATVKEAAELFAHGEQSDGGKTLMWRRIVGLYTLKPVT